MPTRPRNKAGSPHRAYRHAVQSTVHVSYIELASFLLSWLRSLTREARDTHPDRYSPSHDSSRSTPLHGRSQHGSFFHQACSSASSRDPPEQPHASGRGWPIAAQDAGGAFHFMRTRLSFKKDSPEKASGWNSCLIILFAMPSSVLNTGCKTIRQRGNIQSFSSSYLNSSNLINVINPPDCHQWISTHSFQNPHIPFSSVDRIGTQFIFVPASFQKFSMKMSLLLHSHDFYSLFLFSLSPPLSTL